MSIYIIGDPHLSFSPLVDKPMDVFGDEWKDHASRLKEAWESVVMPEDTVIVAGDISWGLRLAEAMPDLAFLYERGAGVEKNLDAAAEWYDKAGWHEKATRLRNGEDLWKMDEKWKMDEDGFWYDSSMPPVWFQDKY